MPNWIIIYSQKRCCSIRSKYVTTNIYKQSRQHNCEAYKLENARIFNIYYGYCKL